MKLTRWLAWPVLTVACTIMLVASYIGDVEVFCAALLSASCALYSWVLDCEEQMMINRQNAKSVASRLRWEVKEEKQAGDKLDSIVVLAARFSVSRGTVRKAISALAQEGLLEVVHGRGIYVLGDTGLRGDRNDRPKDVIARDILNRASGSYLPATTDMVNVYNCSYSTVRRVQLHLANAGHIWRDTHGGYRRT